jgi:hypothetical protein
MQYLVDILAALPKYFKPVPDQVSQFARMPLQPGIDRRVPAQGTRKSKKSMRGHNEFRPFSIGADGCSAAGAVSTWSTGW